MEVIQVKHGDQHNSKVQPHYLLVEQIQYQ
nr:MAG TPA: hypothetical protein [Bacteriophage sp.]